MKKRRRAKFRLDYWSGRADIDGMTAYRYRIRDGAANPKVRHEHFGPTVTSYGEAFDGAVEYFRQNLDKLPPKRFPGCTIEVNRKGNWFMEARIIVSAVIQALKMDEEVKTEFKGDVFS